MTLTFLDDAHREFFAGCVSGDKSSDCISYLVGADETLRTHTKDLYDSKGKMTVTAINAPWISQNGKKLLTLAESLANGTPIAPTKLWNGVKNNVSDVMYEAIDIWRGEGGYDSNAVKCGWLND